MYGIRIFIKFILVFYLFVYCCLEYNYLFCPISSYIYIYQKIIFFGFFNRGIMFRRKNWKPYFRDILVFKDRFCRKSAFVWTPRRKFQHNSHKQLGICAAADNREIQHSLGSHHSLPVPNSKKIFPTKTIDYAGATAWPIGTYTTT